MYVYIEMYAHMHCLYMHLTPCLEQEYDKKNSNACDAGELAPKRSVVLQAKDRDRKRDGTMHFSFIFIFIFAYADSYIPIFHSYSYSYLLTFIHTYLFSKRDDSLEKRRNFQRTHPSS